MYHHPEVGGLGPLNAALVIVSAIVSSPSIYPATQWIFLESTGRPRFGPLFGVGTRVVATRIGDGALG